MSNEKLKQLLENVHTALEDTRELDDETRDLVRELDEDIHRLVESGADAEQFDSAMDKAKVLQARFATKHPVAERFFREIIDVLAKVGI
jgi:hypothetical protein